MSQSNLNAPALPRDEHNRKLVSNVHPAGWTSPTPDGRSNLVVIGRTRLTPIVRSLMAKWLDRTR